MHDQKPPSTVPFLSRQVLLPLAALLAMAASPAQAQDHALYTQATAGTAGYYYNTFQGVVSSSGNGSGTTALDAAVALATASTDEGSGAFHGVQAVTVSADYATAGLHANIQTDDYFSEGRARAQLNDVVTFNVAGADASTVTTIGLDFTLDGTVSALQYVSYLYDMKMYASGRQGLGVGFTTVIGEDPNAAYVGWATSGGTGSPDGFVSWELLAGGVTEKHLHALFTITGAQTVFDLIMGLSLSCGGGTDCNFGNSGHLSFVLPGNVSISSASGLLLTGNVAPVPEPETYALMLAGLGMIGWLRRRRQPTELAPRTP